jgi:hypothetical protein
MTTDSESPTMQMLWHDVAELRDELERHDQELLILTGAGLALCLALLILSWRLVWAAH